LRDLHRQFPKLLRHGWVTTYEMLLGYLLAIAVAIPLAIAITSSQRFDQFVMPTMLFFQVVPKVAVAPCSWSGSASACCRRCWSRSHLVLPDRDRCRGGPALHVVGDERSRALHGCSRLQIFTQFRLPTSLPYLFSGLKVAATLAIAGAVVESSSAPTGPGLSAAGDELQHGTS
jgi:NitT/TauT family transport system permease protein